MQPYFDPTRKTTSKKMEDFLKKKKKKMTSHPYFHISKNQTIVLVTKENQSTLQSRLSKPELSGFLGGENNWTAIHMT
jgi:hypothetical protein